jgi:hypothetical protein
MKKLKHSISLLLLIAICFLPSKAANYYIDSNLISNNLIAGHRNGVGIASEHENGEFNPLLYISPNDKPSPLSIYPNPRYAHPSLSSARQVKIC